MRLRVGYASAECRFYPKPVQRPHPPVHVGGETNAALRRMADLGQGWFGFNRLPGDVPEALSRLDRILEERGRSRDELTISISPYFNPIGAREIEQYAELGVDRVIVTVMAFDVDGLRATLDGMAAELVTASGE